MDFRATLGNFIHSCSLDSWFAYPRWQMARLARKLLPERGIYHVTARGAGRIEIYRDELDRRFFCSLLRVVAERFEWKVHAFCLMGNHYHLVLECEREQMSEGMRILNGLYAQRFNARHGRWGHLFGERYSAWVIHSEDGLEAVCA